MPLSGQDLELYTSKKFRQLMLEKAIPDDLIPYLIADGIFIEADEELIGCEKTRGAKIQQILWIVKSRIDSLGPFVKVLARNVNSYREAIEILGFSEKDIEIEPESPVTFILKNVQFRNFMLEYGSVNDLVPGLRASNILIEGDQELIESKIGRVNQMLALLHILRTRLQTLDPLMVVMQKIPQTYGPALQIIANEGVQTRHEPAAQQQSSKLNEIIEHVKESYKRSFSSFKPMPFYPTVLNICSIWINLRLENRSEGSEPENYKEAIINALRHGPLVLLKGEPGMGKTMTQMRLTYDWATGNLPEYHLVLCARFRDIQRDWETIWDLVLDWMKRQGYLLQQHVQWLKRKVDCMSAVPKMEDSGKKIHVLCFIDGFDEARSECKQLETFIISGQMPFMSTAVVVASRPFALENVRCPSPTLVLSPLSNEQIRDCIGKYLSALRVEDINGEWHKLAYKIDRYNIVRLARIPLLLSCLCFIRDQTSSDSVVDIYLTVCQALIDRQDLQKELKDAIKFSPHKKLSDICIKSPHIAALSKMCLSALVGAQGFKPGTLIFTDQHLERFGVDKDLWLKVGLLSADREEDIGADIFYELPHVTFLEMLAGATLFETLALAKCEYPCGPVTIIEDFPSAVLGSSVLTFIISNMCRDYIKTFKMPLLAAAMIGLVPAAFMYYNQLVSVEPRWARSKVMKDVLWTIKPFSLEQMWRFVIEMAVQSKEGSNKAINNTISVFVARREQRNIQMTHSEHFLQLLLRLLPKTREGLKVQLAREIRGLILYNHTPSSVLSAASQAQLSMYKINDNAVYIGDLDTVVLVKKHNCNTEMRGMERKQWLERLIAWLNRRCFVEQSVLDSLPDTCVQMGWEKIPYIVIHVTEEPVEQQVAQLRTNQIKVDNILFSFNLSSQSGINLSPLFNRFTSFNSIIMHSDNSIIINDLPILFSSQQLKEQIDWIELQSIQFLDNNSAGMFGEEMKNYTKLHTFRLSYSKIGGREMLKLINNLTHCPITDLHILNEHCLSDASIANQLIHLLTKFPKLQHLRLSWNNLSCACIDRLCEQIKEMHRLKEIQLQDDNVKDEHLQLLQNAGLHVVG